MVILTLIKGIAVFGVWGIVIWFAATYGFHAGLAAMVIVICTSAIVAVDEKIKEVELDELDDDDLDEDGEEEDHEA